MAPLGTTHFVHDIFGNVIAETSGTAAGSKREYIWLPETEIAPAREAMSQVDRPLAVVDGVGTTGVVVWNVSVDHLNRPVLIDQRHESGDVDRRLAALGRRAHRHRHPRHPLPRPMVPSRNRLALQLAPELRSDRGPLHAD
jgi:hypothetical protein